MAAGLGFKTFVTGEVLTAADTNGYLMQGVNVFANAAARTAAITSPQEGQMSFLKDTNSTEYYDGSSWAAVGASGGMTLLSTTTLTGGSVTIGSIPSTYNDLRLVIRDFKPATDAQRLIMRINGNSGTVYAYNAPTDDGGETAPNSSSINIGGVADNSVSSNISIFDLYDYANATTWKVSRVVSANVGSTTNTSATRINASYIFYNTTAVTSLVLFAGSGNFTSGTALLYGVK